ncbi:SH3 domain-containing protein [uncultured Desulfosarcina sp.]|nr:SH3 domain-containing protein [uncultured Desulfosarcina sp.]
MTTGCIQQPVQPCPEVADCPPCSTEKADRLAGENRTLQKELVAGRAEMEDLERRIADLEIQLLQKEALTIELQRRAALRQQRLDSAITEVVRTKSKLRTIESKAEAASTIAEAEIAVKSLQSRVDEGAQDQIEVLEKAKRLLEQSTAEFKARNFGGALYLAVQSKNQIAAVDNRFQGRDEGAGMAGETVFSHPLRLKVIKNTNLREGPGLDYKVCSTLESGTAIVGHAYKENWIRIDTEKDQTGWVHQSLVTAR